MRQRFDDPRDIHHHRGRAALFIDRAAHPLDESGLPAPKAFSRIPFPHFNSNSWRLCEEPSPAEQRIRDAPSLGKVVEYDTDWHFVVINCGSKHNLEAGRKLAIRRGGSILGLIHIDEILPEQSVAELDGAWKGDPKAIKPQPGDDVLTYPPF